MSASAMQVSEKIRAKLRELPHKPGVYIMRDRFGTVIYVGKARDIKRRVSQYFHPARKKGWDLKLKALVEAIHDFDIHLVKSEPESLLLEGRLIKEFKPRYNVSFRDDKRFPLLKVNLGDPIPKFTIARFKMDDGARYFGPFVNSSAAKSALELARRRFKLRGCSPMRPVESDHKHCLYANLKYCSAPCIGKIDLEDYRRVVEEACEFLSGQSRAMKSQLEKEMQQAASQLDFERAAMIRDALAGLKESGSRNSKFERLPTRVLSALRPEEDLKELATLLNLPTLPTRIEGFDISNISGQFAVASMVHFLNGKPDRSQYRRYRIKGVTGQNDFACMAEAVRRRYTRLSKDTDAVERSSKDKKIEPKQIYPVSRTSHLPDLILIDGGKGQLGMAVSELEALGLSHIPVIGLAKEFEEIYRPGESDPLRIPHDKGALKLLQRVRDESHRFANTFNAQLRLKKISESVLDEFPGIGPKRKAMLLRQFGSIQRLRNASIEDIMLAPGFGRTMAEELQQFLKSRSGSSEIESS